VHESGADAASWTADNVEKTEALAREAAAAGAARFVFMSTLKVHGEETWDRAVRVTDPISPQDGYARSKALAEDRLAEVSSRTGLEVVVVRAPLVFGPGARANLAAAAQVAVSGVPLPFASIRNRRSWIHVDDLCLLLLACARSEEARAGAFIAAHADPFSTPQLFGGLRERMGMRPGLFPMPAPLLEGAAALVGRRRTMRRLTRSFEADASDTARLLGWEARVPFDRALDDLAVSAQRG
jgi:UDP-glucose 4-epimerase